MLIENPLRLIKLLHAVGGKAYLPGSSADNYLEKNQFREAGIDLEYKSYDYAPYSRLGGRFEGAVTVLDLIVHCGPEAKKYILSRTPGQNRCRVQRRMKTGTV